MICDDETGKCEHLFKVPFTGWLLAVPNRRQPGISTPNFNKTDTSTFTITYKLTRNLYGNLVKQSALNVF